ncbi:MAG: S41 family peptidase [Mogibacterium sp.]|nr:S41 family peptidase [Mogibacterium sp.]
MRSNRRLTVNALWRFALFVFLLGAAAAVTGIAVYYKVIKGGEFLPQEKLDYYQALDQDYGKYYQMQDLIRENSIYTIDADKLDRGIADSVIGAIDDPYATYYTEEEYKAFERKFLSSYTGIGVALAMDEEDRVIVNRVLDGSPAQEEALQEGDIIEAIDGTAPTSVQEASDLIGGEAGTPVTLTLRRGEESFDVQLYRTDVEDKSVRFEEYDETSGIGLITVSAFREGAAEEFKDAVKTLKDRGYEKIIIDVRDNPGGVTQEGVDMADYLLPACKIMTAKNNQGEETVYNSAESAADIEYIVLVNENTASTSEIFAGAIQANGGAKLVGTQTYGKGLIQAVYKLQDHSVFKITIEEYFLPGDKKIDGEGLVPDVLSSDDACYGNAAYLLNIGENR